jgi:aspartyl-tRNA(Asn)/glutamyl-tRNA(Gln) amidotransferase subunit C
MLAFRMAVEFTAGQVEAVARLAQLDLSPAEVELFARQLGEFLGYANEVLAVDTSGVEPTAHVVTLQAPDRPDEVRPSLDRDAALANAPDPALGAGLFRVPRIIG